jgi:hypothetical protein
MHGTYKNSFADPDDNIVAQLLRKMAALGWFHPPKVPDLLLDYLAKVLI